MAFIHALFLATAFMPSTLAAPSLSKIHSRVTGGSLAEPGEFPFIVAPQLNGDQWCAGTLLNNYTVLTAAHCSLNIPPENVTIRAGSMYLHSGGIVTNVTEIKIHPSWKPTVGQNDVALWHLESPIQPSNTIGYAKLIAQNYDPPVGLNAITAGWGTTVANQTGTEASEELRWVDVPIVSRDECKQYGQITANEICAGGEEGKGTCPRDSGGPIFNAETSEILGTVHSGGGCGVKGKPIVYTNLGTLGDWVRQHSWSA